MEGGVKGAWKVLERHTKSGILRVNRTGEGCREHKGFEPH